MRPKNSWTTKLSELESPEILEVFAVNAISPYLLNGSLRPLLKKSPHVNKKMCDCVLKIIRKDILLMFLQWKENFTVLKYLFIFCFCLFINIKSSHHPHTNSAKAALNMMTRTAAVDYAKDRIFMNR